MIAEDDEGTAAQVGLWSAAGATVFSIAYVIAQIFEWLGAIGSNGGPESSSTPLGLVFLLTPSLLLGSTFMILMAALHRVAPPGGKVFSQTALAFATAYATLISMVYFVQLTLVAPRLAAGDTQGIEVFLFVPYRSFLFAVDLLGYSFMSLATLFGAFGLPCSRWMRPAIIAMIANGILVPFLAFQMYEPELIYIAALCALTFPISTFLLALMFRQIEA